MTNDVTCLRCGESPPPDDLTTTRWACRCGYLLIIPIKGPVTFATKDLIDGQTTQTTQADGSTQADE